MEHVVIKTDRQAHNTLPGFLHRLGPCGSTLPCPQDCSVSLSCLPTTPMLRAGHGKHGIPGHSHLSMGLGSIRMCNCLDTDKGQGPEIPTAPKETPIQWPLLRAPGWWILSAQDVALSRENDVRTFSLSKTPGKPENNKHHDNCIFLQS